MGAVYVPADGVVDPGDVGGGAGEHRGLLVHDAADRPKAGDAMHLPRAGGGVLAHQGSA